MTRILGCSLALMLCACAEEPFRFDGGPDASRRDGGGDSSVDAFSADASRDSNPDDVGADSASDASSGDANEVDSGVADAAFDVQMDVQSDVFDGGVDAPCVERCEGVDRLACIDGMEVRQVCTLGACSAGRCPRIDARNTDQEALLDTATADVVVSAAGELSVDTNTGEIVDVTSGAILRRPGDAGDASGILFRRETQGAGPDLGVFAVRSLAVEGRLVATGDAALVILASGPVLIAGELDLSAQGSAAGSGGGAGALVGDGSSPATQGGGGGGRSSTLGGRSGGGGGGHANVGGGGGDGLGAGDRALGGEPGGRHGDLQGEPLAGGGGGGAGAPSVGTETIAPGGGGGGAVQIVSETRITVTGVIRAHGAAGGEAESAAGGGGGAGGRVLLETVELVLRGGIFANGGGGGGGGISPDGTQQPEDGLDLGERASGGFGEIGGGGGGEGGAASPSGNEANSGRPPGGGGGAAGRLGIAAQSIDDTGVVSPGVTTLMLRLR